MRTKRKEEEERGVSIKGEDEEEDGAVRWWREWRIWRIWRSRSRRGGKRRGEERRWRCNRGIERRGEEDEEGEKEEK